ncbi:MAG: hypothetical protein EOM76_05055 [Sphingobacteriia bacterium]|nr:hypothetical protein [Sphingobacteriia bacterium]
MIIKMKKYVFLVYHKQYTNFLEKLRDVGVLHVAEKPEGIPENNQLRDKMQLSAKIKKTLTEATSLLLPNTTPHETTSYNGAELLKEWDTLQADKNRLQQNIAVTQKEAERMKVWENFNSERLAQLTHNGYVLQFFKCSERKFQPEWETKFNAFQINISGPNLYFVTINHNQITIDAEAVTLNEHNSEQLQLDVEAQNLLLVAHQAKMEAWALINISNLKHFAMKIETNIDFQKVELCTTPEADEKVMLLEGYCPQEAEAKLNAMLETEHIYYEISNPKIDEDVPIKLKNNFFAKLFEPITELYSLPNYSEIDPTACFAPFFMLFFGLCLGDGGYGLLILIAATIVKFKFPKFKNLATLGQFLGGSTMLVGLLTGVFFGIMLETVTWPWLANVKSYFITSNNYAAKLGGYDPMMVVAIAVGILQILFAMGFNVVKITIQHGFKYAASTCAWLVGLIDGIILLIPMLGTKFPLPVMYVLYGIAAICALVILFYNSPDKNPIINLGSGLWGTYNMVSGLLGDVLSYIRLFALGLAGGILGNVFNMLATSLTADMSPFVRWLPMLLILLIGHSLNFLLCIISSIVHPLRLTFVEFYKNAGFEGGGKAYRPFKTKI